MSSFHKFLLCVQFFFYVCREHVFEVNYLPELTRQGVGLMSPLFYCLGARLILLLRGFVAKQACLGLWLSKPTFLSDH